MKTELHVTRRHVVGSFIIILVLIICCSVSRVLFEKRPVFVAAISPAVGDAEYAGQNYAWMDNTHVLVFRRLEENAVDVEICSEGGACEPNVRLSTGLSSIASPFTVSTLSVSSQSRRIIYCDAFLRWKMTDFDATHTISMGGTRDSEGEPGALWFPSGNRLVFLGSDDDNRTVITTFDLSGHEVSAGTSDFTSDYYDYAGFLSNGWLMGTTGRIGDGSVTAVQADPSSQPKPRNIFFVPTPRDAYGPVCARVSPDGSKIAWLFCESPPPLGMSVFNQTSFMRRLPTSVNSFWISATDGSKMRKIYAMPQSTVPASVLEWTPNGRWLSFIDKNAVWKIPAS